MKIKITESQLLEVYEQQELSKICNEISTGTNNNTTNFMIDLMKRLNQMQLTPKKKMRINDVFKKFINSVKQVEMGVPKNGGLKGATGDSQSDQGDMYLSQIQDIICTEYMGGRD